MFIVGSTYLIWSTETLQHAIGIDPSINSEYIICGYSYFCYYVHNCIPSTVNLFFVTFIVFVPDDEDVQVSAV